MCDTMRVVQCWDDGVDADVRLIEVLRKHGATGTFNLNAASHENDRVFSWRYKDEIDIFRLGWNEMREVYDGFTIANHSLTHPRLDRLSADEVEKEVVEGRERLEQFFQVPVLGFAYPFGTYNEMVMDILRTSGHVYARTTKNVDQAFPPEDAMAFHPTCKFDDHNFFERYEAAKKCGVFYFWGHSYELTTESMWNDFEAKIKHITNDEQSCWVNICDLFSSD